ncbi:MAG: T9SS type A sorting domain-containing protein [bacterium]|nr:T9SS type A sorting domain-containing protein [bacterium]
MDDDGLPEYDKPADRDTIEIELDALGRSTSHFDEDDVIFIFISDHGDYWRLPLPPDNWHAKFGTWHGEFYRLPPEGGDMFHDDLFADYLRGFTEDSIKVVFMGTCHSGGFKDDLDSPDLNNVILSTAAPHDGIGTTGYLKDIISALNGAIFGFWCVGGDPIPVDADYNNDGYVSIRETHDWTKDPDGGNYTIEMYWLDNQGLGEIVTLAGVLPTSLRIDGISHQEETISPINPADGDGLYEVGEVIQVFATVENQSPNIAENVLLSLSELDPYASGDIEILVGEILLGDIPPNHSKTNEYALRFRVTEELDRNRRADLILTATETSNYSCYEEFEVALCFDPSVSGFFDDLELPMEGWEFDPGVLPEDRQWHLSDLTYHSADHAWRFGNEELDGYTPIEESLYSPLVFLFPNPQFENKLELFHKFSLRPSMLSAGDGMVIEIFTNEYGWKNLFSVHDYSGYSAVDPDWESYSLDFDDPSYSQYLNNLVQIKFHFIPDSTASGDCYGYDVDDIHLGHWTTKGGIYNFLALYENGKVNVGWSCNSGDVTGFNLYRRETGSTENEALTDTESKNGNEAAELNEGETSLSKSGTDKDKALLDPVSPTIDVDEGWTLLNDKAMALSDSNRYVDADVKPDTKYEYKLEALATGGNVEAITTGVTTAEGNVPFSYHLAQSYPNPTGTAANIDFAIPQTENVTLKIYDIKGRCVATPVDGEMPVGIHSVEVDVSSLANGVYIYSLETPGFSKAMKMVVK